MVRWTCVYPLVAVICGVSTFAGAISPPYPHHLLASEDQGENELAETDVNQLNDYIVKYLLYLEKLRQTGRTDQVKQTMHVVKLLIVQTWVSTLEPDMGLLTIPQKKTLQEVQKSIKNSIIKIEHPKMKDYILYYFIKLEPQIRNELESEKNGFKYSEKVLYDDEKVLAENHDYDTIAYFQSAWNGVLDVLHEIRSNMVIHQISSRMILQSYIVNFVHDRNQLGEKFVLISSDGSMKEEFETPDSGDNIYNDINAIAGEVDRDIKKNDKVKYEVYYHILNERIKKYLETFDKLAVKEDVLMEKAMGTVKRLMVQGWIETLEPGPEFLPIENANSLESKKADIVRELTVNNRYSPVSDAILLYTDSKDDEIEKYIKSNSDALVTEYKSKLAILKNIKEKSGNKGDTDKLKEELKDLERKINNENDNLIGHKICKLFYLNSYRQDFLPEAEKNADFKVSASKFYRGTPRFREFHVPVPIDIKSYFTDFIIMDNE